MDPSKIFYKLVKDFKNYISEDRGLKEDLEDLILDLWVENKELSDEEFEILLGVNKKDFYFYEFKSFAELRLPKSSSRMDYKDINFDAVYDNFEKIVGEPVQND